MELPRSILVGTEIMAELGKFILTLGSFEKTIIVSGNNVRQSVQDKVDVSLESVGLSYSWVLTDSPTLSNVEMVEGEAKTNGVDVVIGLGGGKSVDVAKLCAYRLNKPFVSVPTSASHDGIASPFTSIKGLEKPYSLVSRPPIGILADIDIIAKAPPRLLPSGCGDLVAKITAFKDWELGRDDTGEYFGKYAASLAQMSAEIVLDNNISFMKNTHEVTRNVVEALISAGVASGIAGSSRPCSGSEHLFCHALDLLFPGESFHGEKCGLGTIMMAKLHGLDWHTIADALRRVGAPTHGSEIGLSDDMIVKALLMAPTLRPERYTILHKRSLDKDSALDLARSTEVV